MQPHTHALVHRVQCAHRAGGTLPDARDKPTKATRTGQGSPGDDTLVAPGPRLKGGPVGVGVGAPDPKSLCTKMGQRNFGNFNFFPAGKIVVGGGREGLGQGLVQGQGPRAWLPSLPVSEAERTVLRPHGPHQSAGRQEKLSCLCV